MMIISMSLGTKKRTFLTENMVAALFIQVLLLAVFSCLVYMGTLGHTTAEEDDELEDENTLPLNHHVDQRGSKEIVKAATLFFVLVIILSSAFPLLILQFNTCTHLHSSKESEISCSSKAQTYGTICNLTCPPLYWSADSPNTRCMLGGTWSVDEIRFTCRPQKAAVIGSGLKNNTGKFEPSTDLYPPTGRPHPPGLPADIILGKDTILIFKRFLEGKK